MKKLLTLGILTVAIGGLIGTHFIVKSLPPK